MDMKSSEEIINELTHNGKYATDVCLLFYMNEETHYLYYLRRLNITGKKLENLAYKCVPDMDLDYLKQTIRYLSSGFLRDSEIQENLESDNPIPFITKLLNIGDYIERVYESYTFDFLNKFNSKKKR